MTEQSEANFKKNVFEIANKIKQSKAKRILLQLPEGLRTKALDIMTELQSPQRTEVLRDVENQKVFEHNSVKGIEVILAANPCYGACDLPIKEAEMCKADLIVHVGHERFYKNIESKIPVLYHEWPIEINIDEEKVKHELSKIKEKTIGLITSIQYTSSLNNLEKILNKTGKKAVVGKNILGCFTKNAELPTETILFIGTGSFHPTGLSKLLVKTKQKLYFYDLEKNELRDMTNELMLIEKKRFAKLEKLKDAKVVAILVSSKSGQFALERAEKIKKDLENEHKKAFVLIMDEITNEKLMGIRADVFINTACPRITDDHFDKPVINADDVNE